MAAVHSCLGEPTRTEVSTSDKLRRAVIGGLYYMSVTIEGEIQRVPITIRRRVKPGLHILAEAAQVRVDFGRQDKVELSIGGYIDFHNDEDLNTLLFNNTFQTSVRRVFSPGLVRASGVSLRIMDGWLFGGKMIIRPAPGQLRRQVQLHLTINPTRFAAYASRFDVESIAELAGRSSVELLSADREHGDALKQQTLDNNDNWIPHSRWMAIVTSNWSELVQLYLNSIKSVIETDFSERAEQLLCHGLSLSLNDPCGAPLRLKLVETYWEFGASDALLAFAGLERWLSAAAPNMTQTQRVDLRIGRDSAARWIKFEARQGVEIAAYAKASSRLRLEVRHYQRNGRSIGQGLSPALQFSTTTTLLERIERLREDAAGRINYLLRRAPLTPLIQSAASAEAFAILLSEVSRVCTNRRRQLPIIFSQLVASSGVNTERGSGLFNACEALCRSGVLERARVVRRSPSIQFVLVEPYRAAVDGLRSFLSAQAEAATQPLEE